MTTRQSGQIRDSLSEGQMECNLLIFLSSKARDVRNTIGFERMTT